MVEIIDDRTYRHPRGSQHGSPALHSCTRCQPTPTHAERLNAATRQPPRDNCTLQRCCRTSFRLATITTNPPRISATDAGSGAETPAAVSVPLPDVVNPLSPTNPPPEVDPEAPTNSPVPPVKVNVCVKAPMLFAKRSAESTSAMFPDNVSPFANVMVNTPWSSPVVTSNMSCVWNVTGFQIAFKAGLPEITDPFARASRVRMLPFWTGSPVRSPALL